ncbi:bifunctional protein GlmU-like [Schistocerca cancellata]|uniref:bifunctional protein GlmU-like n=1 Tax=Schistocerca cancellata TaxID=274614 RepID=UPI002117C419|nr:bifunctional protein GlmU-like [Schistocerca cancellata]
MEVYPIRLQPGAEIKSSLLQFVKDRDLNAAFVITCCGSITQVILRYATSVENGIVTHKEERLVEPMEILSLTGTVSQDGAHLHTCLGRHDGSVVGGHVIDSMVVQTTAEIVVGNAASYKFTRVMDCATGYGELCVSSCHKMQTEGCFTTE